MSKGKASDTAAISSRPLSSGRLQEKLEFGESSPDIKRPMSLMIDPNSPAAVKKPGAGCETLSEAISSLK